MKAYSQDVREHVLRAVDHGYRHELRLSRCLAFLSPRVTRYIKQRRDEGTSSPKRSLVVMQRNGHRCRLACCPSYWHTTMPPWNNIVPCGSRPMVNA